MASTPLHDGLLVISKGRSRWETNWKNKEISWSDLLKELSKYRVTPETYAEYLTLPPNLQDEKKDVGGFVGGALQGGRRLGSNVTFRSMITLDADFADVDFWGDATFSFPNAMAVYGTHKHREPDTCRYRLIIPLSRTVMRDEYQAIARKIAEIIGIEYFDITTYQPERLMYWPSVSKDSKYYFKWQDGLWIDPDDILRQYVDWTDASQWPMSKREREIIQKHGEKQGNPLEKPGVIGAFNRCYGIVEALETFLSDVYEPVPGTSDKRWSYKLGSTTGGLIVYDDNLFAYSHHGTDPASGMLCSAFDLVRVHKFGLMDKDTEKGTPIHKMPSHIAMENFGSQQAKVRIDLIEQHEKELQEDFASVEEEIAKIQTPVGSSDGDQALDSDIQGTGKNNSERSSGKREEIPKPSETEENKEWKGKLEVDRKGRVLPTAPNFAIIFKHDLKLKNALGWDLFTHIDTCLSDLPWRKIEAVGEPFGEIDMAALRVYFEMKYKASSAPKLKDAFLRNRMRVAYHPIKEFLSGLEWDGHKRLDSLLIDFLNAEDSAYTRAVTRKSFVACVARVFEPGVKFDNVLTLIGPEGLGKSTLLGMMGKRWFSDSLGSVENPKIFEQLQGAWLIEVGELASLRRAEVEMVKHFVAKRADRFRVAYGTHVEEFARQCVFFGTTNTEDFLTDNNGNRRFWPVRVRDGSTLDIFAELPLEVDQLWAEAYHYYKQGEALTLPSALAREAKAQQEAHTEYDHREDLIREYLETPIDEMEPGKAGEKRMRVSTAELWIHAIGGMRKDLIVRNTKDIHRIMKRIEGWKRTDKTFRDPVYGPQKGYERIDQSVTNEAQEDFKDL